MFLVSLWKLSFNPHVFSKVTQSFFSFVWYLWTQIFFFFFLPWEWEVGKLGVWLAGWSKCPLLSLSKLSWFSHCSIPSALEVTGTSSSRGFLFRNQFASVPTSPKRTRLFYHSIYQVTNHLSPIFKTCIDIS